MNTILDLLKTELPLTLGTLIAILAVFLLVLITAYILSVRYVLLKEELAGFYSDEEAGLLEKALGMFAEYIIRPKMREVMFDRKKTGRFFANSLNHLYVDLLIVALISVPARLTNVTINQLVTDQIAAVKAELPIKYQFGKTEIWFPSWCNERKNFKVTIDGSKIIRNAKGKNSFGVQDENGHIEYIGSEPGMCPKTSPKA